MLADVDLRRSIAALRASTRSTSDGWPYVERLVECGDRVAWLIDYGGVRAVSVGGLLWGVDDLVVAAPNLREAATAAIERLDKAPCAAVSDAKSFRCD
jgi:hypothetical protein